MSTPYSNTGAPNQAQDVSFYHQNSDSDSSTAAQHHTLGINNNQASPGDHTHDGRKSKTVVGLSTVS